MSYAESQVHAYRAEQLRSVGDVEGARRLFGLAAEIEWDYVRNLPADKKRSRAVYGLNAASYFFRANRLDEAERVASFLLGLPSLEPYSAVEVRHLLSRIWNEIQLQAHGMTLSDSCLSVVLRNGRVGFGIAPTDVVDGKLTSARNYLRRWLAYLRNQPLTRQAQPQPNESYRTYETMPIASSYRIDIYVASPSQLALDFGPDSSSEAENVFPAANQVISDAVQFAHAAATEDLDRVAELVPAVDYRTALTRVLRNLLPDGTSVGEVELRQVGSYRENAVVLRSAHSKAISRIIRKEGRETLEVPESILSYPTVAKRGELESESLVGLLRAVELDRRKLRLYVDETRYEPLDLAEDILDDALGPLLNHRVRVIRTRGLGKKRWKTTDIEPAE